IRARRRRRRGHHAAPSLARAGATLASRAPSSRPGVTSDVSRTAGALPPRSWDQRSGDRRRADDELEHGSEPRSQHPEQARRALAIGGGRAGGSLRDRGGVVEVAAATVVHLTRTPSGPFGVDRDTRSGSCAAYVAPIRL